MKNFFFGFAVGLVVGTLTTVLAVFAIGMWYKGPTLDVIAEIPPSVELVTPFYIEISATNPHDDLVTLDNVNFPNAFFDNFEVVSVDPEASDDSPVGGLGTQTWYFDIAVPSQETAVVVFKVRAKEVGSHVVEFEVCNSFEDCSKIAKAIEVSTR